MGRLRTVGSYAGIGLAAGTGTVAVPPGNSTGSVASTLRADRPPEWWRSHVRRGERSRLAVNLPVTVPLGPPGPVSPPVPTVRRNVSTDVAGAVGGALERYEGPHPRESPRPVLVVRETDAEWGAVADGETPLRPSFVVENPNPAPLPVPALAGHVDLNGIEMGDYDASRLQVREAPEDGTIGPGETERITVSTRLRTERTDEWLRSHAARGEASNVTVVGALAVEFDGETYTFPEPGGVRCEGYLRTAVFVDDGSTGAGIDECRLARVDAGATAREGAAALADGLGLPGSLGNDSTGEEGLVGGVVGGDDPTPTPTPTADDGPTPTPTPGDGPAAEPTPDDGPTPTPTDDGLGIL